ncbi:MAG: SH3 domain-containing protein [Anaerolineae bacterium]
MARYVVCFLFAFLSLGVALAQDSISVGDEPVQFEFDDEVPGEGWQAPQSTEDGLTFAWTNSEEATLNVEMTQPSAVEFRVLGALDAAIVDSLTLSINGEAAELTRSDEEELSPLGQPASHFEALVPQTLIDEADDNLLVFTFQVSHVMSSALVGGSEPFGVAFDWIRFQPGIEVASGDSRCPVLVEDALERVNDSCAGLERNEVCYGNALAEADPQAGAADFEFAAPGDIVGLEFVQALRLGASDLDDTEWGIALMQVQAEVRNLQRDDTTILLFGDVEIENEYQDYSDGVPAIVNVGFDVLNVRESPNLDADIVTQLREGAEVQVLDGPRVSDDLTWWNIRAEGRSGWAVDNVDGEQTLIFSTIGRLVAGGRATVFVTEDDNLRLRSGPGLSYERIAGLPNNTRVNVLDGPVESDGYTWWQLSTSEGLEGWAADFVDGLPTLTTNSQGPRFGPMQAFTLISDNGELACETTPNGIIIQTPEGEGEVRLLVNEVAIQLNATIYVESQPSDEMNVNVLEGFTRVEAGGVGRVVPEGAVVTIDLDPNSEIESPPSLPAPYDEDAMSQLPIDALKRQIEIAPAGSGIYAGLGTGDVQVTLAWDNDADYDLYVTEPNGQTIFYGSRISSTNGQLDIDSNYPCGSNLGSVENIFWPLDESPEGTFTVQINQFSTCGDGNGNWTLVVRVDGEVVLQEEGSGDSQQFRFNR